MERLSLAWQRWGVSPGHDANSRGMREGGGSQSPLAPPPARLQYNTQVCSGDRGLNVMACFPKHEEHQEIMVCFFPSCEPRRILTHPLRRAARQCDVRPSSFISVRRLFVSSVVCRCKGVRQGKCACGRGGTTRNCYVARTKERTKSFLS